MLSPLDDAKWTPNYSSLAIPDHSLTIEPEDYAFLDSFSYIIHYLIEAISFILNLFG